jgi:Gas vesicle synthesis protein GvpL/GvpF
VEFIEVGDLAAAVDSTLPWEQIQARDEELLKAALLHDRVICDLFRQQPVLPLQFGTIFVSLEGIELHLKRNAEHYQEQIQNFVGMGEYTLKIAPALVENANEDQPEQERFALQEHLEKDYPAVVEGTPRRGIERLHILIPIQQEAQLHAQVSEYQRQCACWDLNLQGPMPPYHFA